MEENHNKPKRTLRDVSHHFFSSLEENKQEKKENAVALSNSSYNVHHFNPSLKLLSIIPIRYSPFSLLLHVYFSKLFLYTPYKVYIISTNPHGDSWDYLQRNLNIPPLVDIDFSKGMRTFTLFKNVELIIASPDKLKDFFSFKNNHQRPSHLFDSESSPSLFLIDCFNTEFYIKEKIISLLDSIILLSSFNIDDFRNAYKVIKAYSSLCPDVKFSYIVDHNENADLADLTRKGFNQITARFLNISVDFIGHCEFKDLARGNNIHWGTEEKDQIFNVNIDFVEALKKENWSEELLSLYETVTSNVKL